MAGFRIDEDQIFGEGSRGSDHARIGVQSEARTVEHELIVAADLVDIDHGHAVFAGRRREDVAAQFALALVIRRGVDADQDLRAGRG